MRTAFLVSIAFFSFDQVLSGDCSWESADDGKKNSIVSNFRKFRWHNTVQNPHSSLLIIFGSHWSPDVPSPAYPLVVAFPTARITAGPECLTGAAAGM